MIAHPDVLRQQLKKDYQNYLRTKKLVESGGWYGDWYHQFKQMEEQRLEALRSKVSETMSKLGYDEKWIEVDVLKELSKMAKEKK